MALLLGTARPAKLRPDSMPGFFSCAFGRIRFYLAVRLACDQSLLGFFGVKSQACFTRARSRPAGENSAISGPLGPGSCTLKMCDPINSRVVPLSMERKRPSNQFQP